MIKTLNDPQKIVDEGAKRTGFSSQDFFTARLWKALLDYAEKGGFRGKKA